MTDLHNKTHLNVHTTGQISVWYQTDKLLVFAKRMTKWYTLRSTLGFYY
ncbi:Unknown protein sequence [Pseudomonas meliae]|uniref:Uncharacterized protein n=1 Tax=Pseudomonas meliae TaxID=86176 RepID=A0A0P9YPN3_9PSED|nr:Unknown protein sequence [Pseudomonas meliae]